MIALREAAFTPARTTRRVFHTALASRYLEQVAHARRRARRYLGARVEKIVRNATL